VDDANLLVHCYDILTGRFSASAAYSNFKKRASNAIIGENCAL